MAIAYTDFLNQVVGGALTPWQNVWVRLVSNNTGTAYISDAVTSSLGKFTFAIKPPGDAYTVYTGPSNTGPWTSTGATSYAVPVVQGENIAEQSVTALTSGPYAATAVAGGADFSGVVRYVFNSAWGQSSAELFTNTQPASLGAGNSKADVIHNLSSLTSIYNATTDYNVAELIYIYAANGTGISIGNFAAGDGIFVETTDDSITAPVVPPNAINVFSGTSGAQTTESGSGGTVTYTATTLTDTGKSWTANQWAANGAGFGRWVVVGAARMLITSNTATILTGTGGWTTNNGVLEQIATSTPASGATYTISQPNGTGINIQRFGSGNAMRIVGQGSSGSAVGNAGANTDLINISQNVDGKSIGIGVDLSSTQHTIAVTNTGKTSGSLISLLHGTSAFSTGNGILMNFASGSGSFTGQFIRFQVNGIDKFSISSSGAVSIAAGQQIDTIAAGALTIGGTNANDLYLGNAACFPNFNYAAIALGGGAAPTLGTIGGSGPATAGQNSWLKVKVGGTVSYVPIWR